MVEPGGEETESVEPRGAPEDVRDWIGAKVDEMDGSTVGRVEAVLVDALEAEPTWIVVRLGRFGRRCGIPVEFVAAGAGHVWVPFKREALRAAAEIDPSGGLSCGDERVLGGHFGIPADNGRLAEIEDRADDDPGSISL